MMAPHRQTGIRDGGASQGPERICLPVTNLYLLHGRRGPVLVDTGYPDDYGRFRRALSRRGLRPADLAVLVLTHHHDDHAGFAARLLEEAPGIRVLARSEAAPRLRAGENAVPEGSSLLNRRIALLYRLKKRLSPGWDHRFPPLRLRQGDLLISEEIRDVEEELGTAALALHTPGHTLDSLALLLPDGSLLCGDLAANFLRFAGSQYCTLFNEDVEAVYRSWEFVLAQGACRILPSHGRPFPAEHLRRHLRAHSRRSTVPFS
jgi:glyoxylase-like metal-dependent hydrolase (beta-lactamase superfamily II)